MEVNKAVKVARSGARKAGRRSERRRVERVKEEQRVRSRATLDSIDIDASLSPACSRVSSAFSGPSCLRLPVPRPSRCHALLAWA